MAKKTQDQDNQIAEKGLLKTRKRIYQRFSVFELIVIAMMASLGLATKPIIVPLVHIITGPLFIPGGAIAGGFYMLWIVLAAGLIKKRGVATMVAIIQGIIVSVSGVVGSHGVVSIVTYTMPGLMVDIVFFLLRRKITTPLDFFLAGVIANLTGTYLSNLVFFRLPWIPLVLSLSAGALSGGLGGIVAYGVVKKILSLEINGLEKTV